MLEQSQIVKIVDAVMAELTPNDDSARERMKNATPARIDVGRCGPRLRTQTMLQLRADHAAARDAVFMDVGEDFLQRLGLFSVVTCCRDKNEFLTRPDLGRMIPAKERQIINEKCKHHVDVQIYVSDGLSSAAIEANAADVLPVLTDGLTAKGLTVGTPFFVKFGRVGAMDPISEMLDAKVTCVLIGERPGLATAESMSVYIAYEARIGMPESRRTVVSNIHSRGTPAVEAGAYLVDLLNEIFTARASGVELRRQEES